MRRLLQNIFKKQIDEVRSMKKIIQSRAERGIGTYVTAWQSFLIHLVEE